MRVSEEVANELARDFGVSRVQSVLLLILSKATEPVKEWRILKLRAYRDRPGFRRALVQLSLRGLVERKIAKNSNTYAYTLTPQGAALVEGIFKFKS